MDKLLITGGNPLFGELRMSGAKNAAAHSCRNLVVRKAGIDRQCAAFA